MLNLLRRGIIVNTFNLNIENLIPICFKNEITIQKPKRNLPTNIRKLSVKEILISNEPEELKVLRQRVIEGKILTREQFKKEALSIQTQTVLNFMGIFANTSTGTIKALKS